MHRGLTEDQAIAQHAREAMIEQGMLNLSCMESLISASTRIQNLKRDRCAILAQDVNLEHIDLMLGETELEMEQRIDQRFGKKAHDSDFTDWPESMEQNKRPKQDFSTPKRVKFH